MNAASLFPQWRADGNHQERWTKVGARNSALIGMALGVDATLKELPRLIPNDHLVLCTANIYCTKRKSSLITSPDPMSKSLEWALTIETLNPLHVVRVPHCGDCARTHRDDIFGVSEAA